MKTIIIYQEGIIGFGVLKTKDWFSDNDTVLWSKDGFVVATWSDYHDGENSHIEGKTTIAVCNDLEDAEIIFKRHLLQFLTKKVED